ncbi:hypothetical protein HMPREF9120_00994 [Neisseria sp. oral taxon 020 str. F0370]|nr:hypothetical protein HMPREF9120_00994 [Neisseria sp. oral taxon 020 str. F0370]
MPPPLNNRCFFRYVGQRPSESPFGVFRRPLSRRQNAGHVCRCLATNRVRTCGTHPTPIFKGRLKTPKGLSDGL